MILARSRGFTRIELSVLLVICGLYSSLLAPALQADRADARRNQCAQQMKQLGLALMNHHDVFKRLPPLTSEGNPKGSANVYATGPGATFKPGTEQGYLEQPAQAAGYGWTTRILPYLEETTLFQHINMRSKKFTLEAFTPVEENFFLTIGQRKQHFATVPIPLLVCPDFGGASISTASKGTSKPDVEIKPYADFYDATEPAVGVAITNYFALSATHLMCMSNPDAIEAAGKEAAEPPNGVIVPGEGTRLRAVLDGASKTLMLCETKEPAVNSWYDGTVCWTVGSNPNGKQPRRAAPEAKGPEAYWSAAGGTTGINFGPDKDPEKLFAPKGTTPSIKQPVSWGPSSDHADGIVLHATADSAVHAIKDDVDPTVYLQLITRYGREPALPPDEN